MINKRIDFEHRFRALGLQLGCDKVINHSYETGYASHLWEIQNEPLKILEIGIGGEGYSDGGRSLILWKNLFPNAQIFGLDIYDKSFLDSDRIKTFMIDQSNASELRQFANEYGPFNLVIDDGSHKREDVLASLWVLMPYVKDNGYYVIEDTSTSYWPTYGGSTIANGFMDTPIDWVKKAVDILHRDDLVSTKDNLPDWDLRSISVYSGLAFLGIGKARVSINVPKSTGFYEDQRDVDEARYGKYSNFFNAFAHDPLRSIEKLLDKPDLSLTQ